jgi:hypothetical protein
MSATLLARTRQGLPRSALLLTLLRLAPMRAGALLLSQLVLFLPVITGAFGWLSRRLDHGGDSAPFASFHLADRMLLSCEPSGAIASTRLMKTMCLVRGVVMLDRVALTLSRAIGLASGGG